MRKLKFLIYHWIGFVFISCNIVFSNELKNDTTYFDEPDYTQGNSNQVEVQFPECTDLKEDSLVVDHYIFTEEDIFLFKEGKCPMALSTSFPPTEAKPLEHGIKYGFFFRIVKIDDSGSKKIISQSPPVFSIQDTSPPEMTACNFVGIVDGGWSNKENFQIEYEVKDPAGIQYVYLFQLVQGDDWSQEQKKEYDKDTSGHPKFTEVDDNFDIFNISEDNHYEFFIGARDAAHAPESCAKKWILDGNEKKPGKSDYPHLRINIDTVKPEAEIKNINKFQNKLKFDIPYFVDDPINSPHKIESGIDSVSLYYFYDKIDNDSVFVFRHGFDELKESKDSVFKNVTVDNQGNYWFYIKVVDHAGNITISEKKLVVVDTTQPNISLFQLKDTLTTATEEYTFAENGRTKFDSIWAKIEVADALAGLKMIKFEGDLVLDSIVFEKDIKQLEDSLLLKLSDGDGKKNINCIVTDNADNSMIKSDTIFLDTKKPQITNFELCDLDGSSCTETDQRKVKVILSVNDFENTNLKRILYDSSLIKINQRDVSWLKYLSNDTTFNFDYYFAPCSLYLHALIRDFAGNISNPVTTSIYYLPPLLIENFELEDKDKPIYNNQEISLTNDLVINTKIIKISRNPGENAYFEFCKDSTKIETLKEIPYNINQRISETMWRVSLNLRDLGYNSTNDLKYVCMRLVAPTINGKSDWICNKIFLDTIPPDWSKAKFILGDITQVDKYPDEFKAEVGWTNEKRMYAKIEKTPYDTSGCDRLWFYGDVVEVKDIEWSDSVLLDLKDSYKLKNQVFVNASDIVGNWGNDSIPSSIDTACISWDSEIPLLNFKLQNNEELALINGMTNIKLSIDDNQCLSKLFLKEDSQKEIKKEFEEPKPKTAEIVKQMPISSPGFHEISGVAVDCAGNPSVEDKQNVEVIGLKEDLFCNAPNPFNPGIAKETKIIVVTPGNENIDIKIYDVFGNLVISFFEQGDTRQYYEFPWDGRNGKGEPVAEGIYIGIARIGNFPIRDTKIGIVRR